MNARIESFDEDIEELVIVQIDGQTIACFATVCPYRLERGQTYPISLEMFVNDEYTVIEAEPDDSPGFERIGQSLAYWVCGILGDGVLDAGGVKLRDEVLLSEYGHMENRLVKVRADRLDAEFLPLEDDENDGPTRKPSHHTTARE